MQDFEIIQCILQIVQIDKSHATLSQRNFVSCDQHCPHMSISQELSESFADTAI